MSAATDTKVTQERERIAGAQACFAIIQKLEQMVVPDSSDRSMPAWTAKRQAAIAALLETAGELSPRAAGAMAVLAELVVSEIQDGSTYDLDQWKPNECRPRQRPSSREATA